MCARLLLTASSRARAHNGHSRLFYTKIVHDWPEVGQSPHRRSFDWPSASTETDSTLALKSKSTDAFFCAVKLKRRLDTIWLGIRPPFTQCPPTPHPPTQVYGRRRPHCCIPWWGRNNGISVFQWAATSIQRFYSLLIWLLSRFT